MEFFFFYRKDKLLSKCNNCFNNVPQPPKKLQKEKKRNWKIGILQLHDQLIAASSPGHAHASEGMMLFGTSESLTVIKKKQKEDLPSKYF